MAANELVTEEPETGEEQEQRMRLSPELYALEKIIRILNQQPPTAQRRMVAYLADRYDGRDES